MRDGGPGLVGGAHVTERPTREFVELLELCRERERAQTRFYRALAAEAELQGRMDVAERLNALHADEQHHLSRLTARLLELGVKPRELAPGNAPAADLDSWEATARTREAGEVSWYQELLERAVDAQTRALFEEILASEQKHRDELGGKWMPA